MIKLKAGYEKVNSEIEKKKTENKGRVTSSEVNKVRPDSLTRSATLLLDYATNHTEEWKSFITLTFGENVTDIGKANSEFNKYITQLRRKYPFLKYLGVPEYQERGAVHYHILTNLEHDKHIPKRPPKKIWSTSKKRWYTIEYYDLPYWIYGFSTSFNLETTDDKFNVGLYIAYYLLKECDQRLYGRNKILKSNAVKKPVALYYKDTDHKYIQALQYVLKHTHTKKEVTPRRDYGIPYQDITTKLSHDHFTAYVDIIKGGL